MTPAPCASCGAEHAPAEGLCVACYARRERVPARPSGSRVAPAWPAPLDAAAYHGVVGDATRAIEPHSESDPAALLVTLLVLAGNLLGRHAFRRVEADEHYSNLYALVVGESAKARKGTSLGRSRALMRLADPDHDRERVLGGLSSAEGLVDAVRDPVTEQEWDRKAGEWRDKPTDPGVSDKRLMVVEPEFAAVLRTMDRKGNTLSAAIRNLWDRGEHRFMTKTSKTATTGAHVSVLAHITTDELRRELRQTDRANGFANRFLFVCARRSKLLPDGGALRERELRPLAEKVKSAGDHARRLTELDRDPAARERWHAAYPELSAGHPGMLGAVTSRGEAQVTRLAALYAVLDERDRIAVEHLDAALEVWRYCEASAAYVFGQSLGDPLADALLDALRDAGGRMTRTEVRDHFARHAEAARLAAAIGSLQAAGLVRVEQEDTGGRPAELLVLTDRDESDRSDQRSGAEDFGRFGRIGRAPAPGDQDHAGSATQSGAP